MGKPPMKKYIKGLNLIALLALGQAAAAKQPNESRVTLINGSWNPGEGGPVTTQANPLNRPFGVDFDSQGRMWIVELEGGRVHRLANGWRPGWFTCCCGCCGLHGAFVCPIRTG